MTFIEIILQSMLSGFSSYFGAKVAIKAEKHIKNKTIEKIKKYLKF